MGYILKDGLGWVSYGSAIPSYLINVQNVLQNVGKISTFPPCDGWESLFHSTHVNTGFSSLWWVTVSLVWSDTLLLFSLHFPEFCHLKYLFCKPFRHFYFFFENFSVNFFSLFSMGLHVFFLIIFSMLYLNLGYLPFISDGKIIYLIVWTIFVFSCHHFL